ncbi:unnamed protein product [Rodentolepis nana]|uniref:SCP domain-containing protein n=1 Tax=Rodentolepis nana TaxID=102285 RepID=A0A0R3T8S7_RODNA|nr:unnamed protein product [Rodentolepis nana]
MLEKITLLVYVYPICTYEMTAELREEVVENHNAVRSGVSPSASNVKAMKYSKSLEALAETTAKAGKDETIDVRNTYYTYDLNLVNFSSVIYKWFQTFLIFAITT